MARQLKGQSAMEYLMTYGWAILIVIIVVAVLFSLGLFNPSTFTQTTATGFSGFNAPTGGWQLTSGGTLTVQLTNGVGSTINITEAGANVGSSHVINAYSGPAGNAVSPGQTVTLTFTGLTGPASAAAYSAKVNITYTNVGSGVTGFRSAGTLTGTVS